MSHQAASKLWQPYELVTRVSIIKSTAQLFESQDAAFLLLVAFNFFLHDFWAVGSNDC